MCKDEKIVVCEVSYLPLDGDTNVHIEDILDLITKSNVDYEIGSYRTILKGNINTIMELTKSMYQKADSLGSFVIDVRFSNTCGCIIDS